ncbi:hypothetical protein XELAEV_18014816mg [Xenopus laevis]|uniref:Uncharacterized protein n=1 Tax=Xenopus laevis TaxID=8355 RepID=A0A974DIR6_XENLA|nr:hypothetical protein XELAEV_18014816mg [Xenopus laevis]
MQCHVQGSSKLKDLYFLKGQIEVLQHRLENEVQAGVAKDGSFLSSPFLKGFLAGNVVAKLQMSTVLGFVIGTCSGIYAAQT